MRTDSNAMETRITGVSKPSATAAFGTQKNYENTNVRAKNASRARRPWMAPGRFGYDPFGALRHFAALVNVPWVG
jgi:hypothetical protein